MSNSIFGESNLVKSYRLLKDGDEPRVIDSNSLIEEKLERIRMIMPTINNAQDYGYEGKEGFVDGLDATMLDALTGDGEGYDPENGDGFASGVIKATPVYDGPTPEELIEDARLQIEQMRQDAEAEIEAARQAGYEDGVNRGYSEGKAAAEAEMSRAWNQIGNAKAELEAEREQMIAELEPQFVDVITSIYEQIFKINLSSDKEMVITLLRDTMMKVESCKNYLVHVSPEDREYVVSHKEELMTSSMPEDATVDIIEDVTMKPGDCLIETSNGIYDCGLGTQLAELKKKLVMLSFTP